jgi:hypothetical protein
MIKEQVDFMVEHTQTPDNMIMPFSESETERMKRIYELFINRDKDSQVLNRRNFKAFVDEHDRRRGTNFLATFPEMASFYSVCGS